MIRQALELERDAAQDLRPRRLLALRERFHHLAVRGGVSDAGVARQRLRIVDRAQAGSPDQRVLDPAVLIAEGDLEMEDVLAVALEAEVPGLDDPGVDRADRHLVDLVALHAVEVRDADQRGFTVRRHERLMAGPLRALEANRLEPRVAARAQTELLGDLALEQMHLRDRRGSATRTRRPARGSGRGAAARADRRRAPTIRPTASGSGSAIPKKAATRSPARDRLRDRAEELVRRELRHGGARDRAAVAAGREAHALAAPAHGILSR